MEGGQGVKTETEKKGYPAHLVGREAIAKVFGVGPRTINRWVEEGAPIFMVGKKRQANYDDLWRWLAQNRQKSK